jgi:crotonobetaine/carnitine-CoA ligase
VNRLALDDYTDRNFGRVLQLQSEAVGDIDFLITDDQCMTFAEAETITNRLATGLRAMGIGKGDRIALFMQNCPELILLTLAINKLQAVWTAVNTDFKGEWLLDNVQRCRCKALCTDAALQSRVADIQSQLSIEHYVLLGDTTTSPLTGVSDYATLLDHEPAAIDYSGQHYGDTCAILWTSGTTGKSKGVMQSYNAWIRAIVKGASVLYDSQPGDSIYCVLPLYNSGAWITSVYRALLEGIPCIIEQKFSVSTFWERIEHFGATQVFAIGAMGVFLINAPEQPGDATTPLKTAQIVPLPPNQWKPFEQRFGVRLLRTGLGMSECLLIMNQCEARDDVPVYALGFPPDDIEVALLGDDGLPVPDGEPGEICVRPLVDHIIFDGYFDNPEATADAFLGDWFRTGDLGRRDPTTQAYFFVDRKKDAVRFGGRNISTLEVESVVRAHPAVADVAAFGIPSQEVDSEDELKLNVVLKPDQAITHEGLCKFLNDNAPHFFVPRYLEFVDALPYTPTNKVQKFKLRETGVTGSTWDIRQSGFEVKR